MCIMKRLIMNRSDIERVKEAHTAELMRIGGVVGIYVGVTRRGNQCIVVMIDEDNAAIRRIIPARIEGYKVKVEVSGPIKPMGRHS